MRRVWWLGIGMAAFVAVGSTDTFWIQFPVSIAGWVCLIIYDKCVDRAQTGRVV
jgi:hypothetical protein